jgi:glycosyltransferase involved in cell wall biosynthesis
MLERAGFPSERIRLVRYGIPLNGSTSSDASEGKGVLFAGRLSVEKGIDVLVRAAAHLPEIPFVVAGDGPLREAVESGPSNMKLIGHVSPTQLDEWRRRTAMTVVPSTCYEVSPFAALEALAQGQPVVGSRIGGIPEIVREGVSGVLVPPNEELPLVDAIRTLHADASRRVTLSERGRRLVESEYELECQTDRVLEAYGVTV